MSQLPKPDPTTALFEEIFATPHIITQPKTLNRLVAIFEANGEGVCHCYDQLIALSGNDEGPRCPCCQQQVGKGPPSPRVEEIVQKRLILWKRVTEAGRLIAAAGEQLGVPIEPLMTYLSVTEWRERGIHFHDAEIVARRVSHAAVVKRIITKANATAPGAQESAGTESPAPVAPEAMMASADLAKHFQVPPEALRKQLEPTDVTSLRRFKNLMQGYVDQLRAADPNSTIIMADAAIEGQINAIAKQLGWWEPFHRQADGSWLAVNSASGAYCGGTLMFDATEEDEKAWGRDERGALQVPAGVVAEWHQGRVQMMLPLLLSWITKVDDALLSARSEADAKPAPAATGGEASALAVVAPTNGETKIQLRRGRLPKDESDAKRADLLATIRQHPSLKDDPKRLAEDIGVSESTVRRWLAEEEQKYLDSRPANADADED